MELRVEDLAKMIDHTLLRPNATVKDVLKLCDEALKYRFASVCVSPCYVSLAAKALRDSPVRVGTVVGFPLGSSTTQTKVFEASEAVRNGALEIDMVINIGMLKSGDLNYVRKDIEEVVKTVKNLVSNAIVKVIIETGYLTREEKITACKLAVEAGADFVKTSTGFGPKGATVEDVKLMKSVVGDRAGVKAAGGIRTLSQALAMIKAGASRIGTSTAIAIISELEESG